ncbi:MFS transporter [Sinorhizobium sp. BJ1]|uniref:MFS transporter n=1 Tax=Sinorhizobium sp. BJ1 TaxID=2035455 RepID=UPI000BE9B554|nr:MFS transporter [Sinorhizobium sp. BJ1]PDT80141.1 MFS transporter [Sinorhizobium sp. BJ1]
MTSYPQETFAAGTEQAVSVRWTLASLSLSMLLASLGTSIANVGLPTLAGAFSASFQEVQWVVLAYLLATTTLIISVGRLGDIVGRRKLLLAGIALFTMASASCAAAPHLSWLVAARAVQGLGAAVMMALAMAMVGEAVPKERTGSAMGLLGTMSAIGTALGPSLGGVLIGGFGWRAIFLVTVPCGLLALFLGHHALPAARPRAKSTRPAFDVIGTLVLALTLGAYALAMTIGGGTFGTINLILLLAAIFGICAFLFVESRAASPLVRLATLREPRLRSGLATSMLVATVMMTTLVVGPFYLSRGLGLDAALVGLVMSAGPVVSALAGVPAGRLVDRFGAGRMAAAGLGIMAIGCLALSVVPQPFGVAGYVMPLVTLTAGYALFQAANTTGVMKDARPEQRGIVSGLLNLSRNLGLVTGASVMGAVFSFAATASAFTTADGVAAAAGMRATFAVATVLVVFAAAIAVASRVHVVEPTPEETEGVGS